MTSDSYRYQYGRGHARRVTGDDTRWGGTVGVGLEYAFAPNWSVGIEYDHLFMQDRTYGFATPAGAAFGNDRIRQDVDIVIARLNYRFGGPGSRSTDLSRFKRQGRSPGQCPGLFRRGERLTIGKAGDSAANRRS